MQFIRWTMIEIPMLYRELHDRIGLQWNRFTKGKFWKLLNIKKKNWHWHKAEGNSIKQTTKVDFVKVKLRRPCYPFDLFENSDGGHCCSEYRTKNFCCLAAPQRVSWLGGQLQLASMKCLGKAHLFSDQCLLLALGYLDSFPIATVKGVA